MLQAEEGTKKRKRKKKNTKTPAEKCKAAVRCEQLGSKVHHCARGIEGVSV